MQNTEGAKTHKRLITNPIAQRFYIKKMKIGIELKQEIEMSYK